MSGVNKVILLGRLGDDPSLKYTPAGNAVCNFSMATSESYKDKSSGEKREKTEWHRLVAWGQKAELINQYLRKGSQAYIEGKLKTRSWDGNDGQKRYMTEIEVETIQFIGGKQESGSRGFDHDSPENVALDQATFTADDIPF